jgi:hypothetical protein|tara:strand:- start:453 stop:575 length:123 start_codon:yes stop_codon:yes gene_type:complete
MAKKTTPKKPTPKKIKVNRKTGKVTIGNKSLKKMTKMKKY